MHQMRCNSVVKKVKTVEEKAQVKQNFKDLIWMSKEKMDDSLGKLKAEHWRESKKIRSRPDPLTGSTDENFVEWGVPQDWERLSDEDIKKMQLTTQGDAEEGDHEALKKFGTADDTVKIKTEPVEEPSEMQKLAQRVSHVKENAAQHLRQLQDNILEAKKIINKCENITDPTTNRYNAGLVSDIQKYLGKATKTSKILDRMATEEVKDDSQIHTLLTTMDQLAKQYEEITTWAARFNLTEDKPAKRRRKAKGSA